MIKSRTTLILLFFLTILLSACTFNSSLKDYSLNPDKYLCKEINITGKYVGDALLETEAYRKTFIVFSRTFVDSDGYMLSILPNKRVFELNNNYDITGILIKSGKVYYVIENEAKAKEFGCANNE